MKSSGMVANTLKFTFCKKKYLNFKLRVPENSGGVSARYILVARYNLFAVSCYERS